MRCARQKLNRKMAVLNTLDTHASNDSANINNLLEATLSFSSFPKEPQHGWPDMARHIQTPFLSNAQWPACRCYQGGRWPGPPRALMLHGTLRFLRRLAPEGTKKGTDGKAQTETYSGGGTLWHVFLPRQPGLRCWSPFPTSTSPLSRLIKANRDSSLSLLAAGALLLTALKHGAGREMLLSPIGSWQPYAVLRPAQVEVDAAVGVVSLQEF